MPLPQGMTADVSNTVSFEDGLASAGTLSAQNGWNWNGDKPATYSTSGTTGFKWAGGAAGSAGGAVAYTFDSGSNWTVNEIAVWKASLALFADTADISFNEAATPGAAKLVLYRNPTTTPPPGQGDGAYASTQRPGGTVGDTTLPAAASSLVSLQTGNDGAYFNFNGTFTTLFAGQGGGSGLSTVVHELAHTLGLFHTGAYNADVNPATQQFSPVDTWAYSIMSYIAPETTTAKYFAQYPNAGTSWGTSAGFGREPTTPMIVDIASLQQLYGSSTTAAFAGGQTYGFNCNIQADVKPFFDFTVNTKPIVTLTNRGVGNTLDLSGYATASTVNLNAGAFSSFAGLVNNVAIAYGTRIDAAVGGSADDTFVENANGDTIDGGAGANTVVLRLNQADYTMTRTPANVVTVTTRSAGVTDTLSNVATLRFADGSTLQTSAIACYARGTRLAVPEGQALVERLAIGDSVVTASGAVRQVKWIGTRAYAGPFLAANPGAQPIRVHAGAIADGIPVRDLHVSARHALFLDGLLIPAESLVNGVSVTRCTDWAEVEYFHIELHSHDILLAEGCPAESFVDDDSRGMFHNAAGFAALYPGEDPSRGQFCAEVVEHGEALESVRRRLADRAGLVLPDLDAAPAAVQAHLDTVTHDTVEGWAWSEGGGPVRLEISDGGQVLARVTANMYRADLRDAGLGDGRCAFRVRGLMLDPAVPHFIRIRRASDGALLGERALAAAHDSVTALASIEARLAAISSAADGTADLDGMIRFLDVQAERLRQARAAGRGVARPLTARPRALFVDDLPPARNRDAGSCAALSHMESLQRLGWDVSFAASQPHGGDAGALEAAGVQALLAPAYGSVESVLRRHAGQFDLIYLHRGSNAAHYMALARNCCPRARVVYSVADLHHLRLERQAVVESRPELARHAARVRVQELLSAAQADAVLTHSSHEAALLRAAAPGANVRVVPWAVGPDAAPAPFAERRGVGMLGNFAHSPNVDAALWLAREVMPLVWRAESALPLVLAGSAMPGVVRGLAGPLVEVLGHVAVTSELFGRVRLTVAPLRFGAGVKGKVLDSLAAGVPVAMTPVAAEGAGLPDTVSAFVSGTAEGLAEHILRLHGDAAANGEAASAGVGYVASTCTPAHVDAALHIAVGRPARIRAA